jgi:hypothetical protein
VAASRRWSRILGLAALLWVSSEGVALAAAKPATKLVNVADTRMLEPGFARWLADLYNTSLWQFALVTVGIMVVMGLALGLVCDRLVSLLGINLGRGQHHE